MHNRTRHALAFALSLSVLAFTPLSAGEVSHGRSDNRLNAEFIDAVADTLFPVSIGISGSTVFPYDAPGCTVGVTWYEYQHNGSMGRQIGCGSGTAYTGVHFVWMRTLTCGGARKIAYNAYDGSEWAWGTGIGGGRDISEWNGGYTTLDVSANGAAAVAFHQGLCGDLLTTKSAIDSDPPLAVFSFGIGAPGPPNCEGWITGSYENESKYIWPVVAYDNVAGEDILHVVSCESPPSGTLSAEIQTVVYYRIDGGGYPTCGRAVDSVYNISPVVRSDPISDRVAIVWLKPTYYEGDPRDPCGYLQWQNDVVYVESSDGGLNWGPLVNITDYSRGQTLAPDQVEYLAYNDVSAMYDHAGTLHIVWNTPLRDLESESPCTPLYTTKLWHWSWLNECVSLVYDACRPRYHCPPGAFNRTTAKMNISECYSSSYGEYGLFVSFTRFGAHVSGDGDTNIDCSDPDDHGFYANGDIFLAGSSDGGFTWGPDPSAPIYADTSDADGHPSRHGAATNLTNTFTPDCLPGECHNEHFGSMAMHSNDSLFIMYIDDRDAGSSVISNPREGVPTQCPVKYMNHPFFKPAPVCSIVASSTLFEAAIAPAGMEGCSLPYTSQFTLTLTNLGNQPASWIAAAGSAWLHPSVESGTVPRDCDITSDIVYEIGPVENPGSYTDTVVIGYYCADGESTIEVYVTVLVMCESIGPEYVTLSTACWSVAVWNVGRAGIAEISDTGNMFWFSEDVSVMYDQGVIITYAEDTSNTWFSMSGGSLSNAGFTALAPVTAESLSGCRRATGSWSTDDEGVIGFTEYLFPTSPDTCAMIEIMEICNHDSGALRTIHVGEAIDWNIPDDEGGSANRCGLDEERRMVFQYGPPGAQTESFFAGASFCGDVVGATVLENAEWIYPNNGFIPAEIGGLLAGHTGFFAQSPDSLQDLSALYVVARNITLQPAECANFCMVKTSSLTGLADLQMQIDRGKAWIAERRTPPDNLPCGRVYRSADSCLFGQGTSPVGSKWHELHPNFCENWTIISFCDGGDNTLGRGDLIVLEKSGSLEESDEHVRSRTTVLSVQQWYSGYDMHLYSLRDEPADGFVGNPVGTWWCEVHPTCGGKWTVTGWLDNENGFLDSCDLVVLRSYPAQSAFIFSVTGMRTGVISDPFLISDANGNGYVDIDDVVYIIAYIFTGGPAPAPHPAASADGDCNCMVDIDDVVHTIGYIFVGGPAPCSCDEWTANCPDMCD